MKRFLVAACCAALLAATANAALDTYTLSGHIAVLPGVTITNPAALTTITGASVSTVPYSGTGTLCVDIGAVGTNDETNRLLIVTIQRTNTVTAAWDALYTITNSTGVASFTRHRIEIGKGGPYIRGVVESTNGTGCASIMLNAH